MSSSYIFGAHNWKMYNAVMVGRFLAGLPGIHAHFGINKLTLCNGSASHDVATTIVDSITGVFSNVKCTRHILRVQINALNMQKNTAKRRHHPRIGSDYSIGIYIGWLKSVTVRWSTVTKGCSIMKIKHVYINALRIMSDASDCNALW